eukprot:365576-Chlamydomonas_euryale.AAC.5
MGGTMVNRLDHAVNECACAVHTGVHRAVHTVPSTLPCPATEHAAQLYSRPRCCCVRVCYVAGPCLPLGPPARYGGYSYEEVMLHPLADALGGAIPEWMPVYFALQVSAREGRFFVHRLAVCLPAEPLKHVPKQRSQSMSLSSAPKACP